jgi:hypothetical protein
MSGAFSNAARVVAAGCAGLAMTGPVVLTVPLLASESYGRFVRVQQLGGEHHHHVGIIIIVVNNPTADSSVFSS